MRVDSRPVAVCLHHMRAHMLDAPTLVRPCAPARAPALTAQLHGLESLLDAVSSDPTACDAFLGASGVGTVVSAMREFCFNTELQARALALFARLAADDADCAAAVRDAGLPSMARSCLQRHCEAPAIAKAVHALLAAVSAAGPAPKSAAAAAEPAGGGGGGDDPSAPAPRPRRRRRAARRRPKAPVAALRTREGFPRLSTVQWTPQRQATAVDLLGSPKSGPSSSPKPARRAPTVEPAGGLGAPDAQPPHPGSRLLRTLSPQRRPRPRPRPTTTTVTPLRRSKPGKPRPHTTRAVEVEEEEEEADVDFSRLVDLVPAVAAPLLRTLEDRLRLAAAMMAAKRFDEARAEYEGILAGGDAACVPALYHAGLLNARAGDRSRARKQLRRVLEIDPAHAKARVALESLG